MKKLISNYFLNKSFIKFVGVALLYGLTNLFMVCVVSIFTKTKSTEAASSLLTILVVVYLTILLIAFSYLSNKLAGLDRLTKAKNEMLSSVELETKILFSDIDTTGQSEEVATQKEALSKYRSKKDILTLMFENMAEIRDYFSISKSHARLSFYLSIISCVIGIVLLGLSVYYAITSPNLEPSIIAGVSGGISEVFAFTTLLVHKNSLSQLNHYYNALHENEMFLSTINLVGNLSLEKQDDIYVEIIRNELNVRLNKLTKNSKDSASIKNIRKGVPYEQ